MDKKPQIGALIGFKSVLYIYMNNILNDPFTHVVSFYLVIGVTGKVKK